MRFLFVMALLPVVARGGGAVSLLEEAADHPLCQRCKCDRSMVPIMVDCSGRGMQRMFGSDADVWQMDQREARETMIDIDFGQNKIEKVVPFPEFNVHSIKLDRNQIDRIEPLSFAQLNFLTYLDLSHNDLGPKDLRAETFEGQYDKEQGVKKPLPLMELDLGFNDLSALDNAAFVHLTKLRTLILDGNPITRIGDDTAAALSALPALTSLSLKGCSLRRLPDNFLQHFAGLERLSLADNFFTDIHDDLQHVNTLKELDISGNAFKEFDKETFHGLESLRTLRANEMTRLVRVKEAAFFGVPHLETLVMSGNPGLRFIHPDAFDRATAQEFRMTELRLADNALRYLPKELLPHQSNWQDIETLDLEGNPWSCDCHNDFLTSDLVSQIASRTPELADGVVCGGPGDLKGMPVVALDLQPEEVPCPQGDKFNPYKESYGVKPHPKYILDRLRKARARELEEQEEEEDDEMENHDRLAAGVAITCMVVIGVTACVVGALYWRKRRRNNQAYRSLHNVRFGASASAASASIDGYRDTGEFDDANHEDIVRRVGGSM